LEVRLGAQPEDLKPGGWSWDVGLYYVGEMGEGMLGRRLFDFVTESDVKWNPYPIRAVHCWTYYRIG
jgi:hypothetical protein